jgi:hypothetical protein
MKTVDSQKIKKNGFRQIDQKIRLDSTGAIELLCGQQQYHYFLMIYGQRCMNDNDMYWIK